MLSIASFLLSMLLGLLFLFIIEFGILKPYKQWEAFFDNANAIMVKVLKRMEEEE